MQLNESLNKQGKWMSNNRWIMLLSLAIGYIIFVSATSNPAKFHFRHTVSGHTYLNICILISLTGFFMRVYVKGYNPENNSLKIVKGKVMGKFFDTGVYSILRHPLRIADFTIWLGFILFSANAGFTIIFTLLYCLYLERLIIAQEQTLSRVFGLKYSDYAKKTPAFFPDAYLYKKPELKFNFKKAISKETPKLITIFGFFFICDLLYDNAEEKITPDHFLLNCFLVAIIMHLLINYKRLFKSLVSKFKGFK